MLINGLIGLILGFLAGLGVGGGSLLMLWLTAFMDLDYNTARLLNLMFFIPCAFISILLRKQASKISFRDLCPAILAGMLSAAVCSNINISVKLLKKGFGVLLLFTGIREICYRPRKPR